MSNHIQDILSTTLDSLQGLIDVNTIVGEPITAPDGSVILPVSRVSFGFVAGGGEYDGKETPAFAGGTGAGVTLNPVAFLVAGCDPVRVLPAVPQGGGGVYERLVDMLPQAISELRALLTKRPTPPPQAPSRPQGTG